MPTPPTADNGAAASLDTDETQELMRRANATHLGDESESSLAPPRSRKRWQQIALGVLLVACGIALGYFLAPNRATNPAIATVNGETIPQSEFYHRLEAASGPALLQQMIQEKLLLQFAAKQGTLPPDSDIETKLAEARKQPNFAATLTGSLQTEDDLKRALRLNLAQTSVLDKGVTVSDADVRAFYAQNSEKNNPKARYYAPETVVVGAIVTNQEADARQAMTELAKGRAFAEVARALSNDRSALNGGLLPPIQKGRSRFAKLPGLEARLYAMKPGDLLEPTKFGASWWLVRCLKHTPETLIPFEQVAEECRQGAMLTKGLAANGAQMNADFEAFKKSSEIVFQANELKSLKK